MLPKQNLNVDREKAGHHQGDWSLQLLEDGEDDDDDEDDEDGDCDFN